MARAPWGRRRRRVRRRAARHAAADGHDAGDAAIGLRFLPPPGRPATLLATTRQHRRRLGRQGERTAAGLEDGPIALGDLGRPTMAKCPACSILSSDRVLKPTAGYPPAAIVLNIPMAAPNQPPSPLAVEDEREGDRCPRCADRRDAASAAPREVRRGTVRSRTAGSRPGSTGRGAHETLAVTTSTRALCRSLTSPLDGVALSAT
jgi:hypothetical protein